MPNRRARVSSPAISRIALATLLHAAAMPAHAAVFCVTPGTDLGAVFQTVASNGQADQIRFVQGVYNATGQTFGFSVPGDVELVGGWLPGCAQRSFNPALTVINGGFDGQPRLFNVAARGSLLATGFTFTGFVQIDFGRFDLAQPATGPTVVERNLFLFNDTSGVSGALVTVNTTPDGAQGEPRTIVRNNVFRDNVTGAALTISNQSLSTGHRALVLNNTFVDNQLGGPTIDYGPGPAQPRQLLFMHNNLLSGGGATGEQVRLDNQVLADFRSNILQRCAICGIGSNGNTSATPQFDDSESLRPAAGSPARNAGYANSAVGTLDFAGNARVQEGAVDIGALEHLPPLFADGFE